MKKNNFRNNSALLIFLFLQISFAQPKTIIATITGFKNNTKVKLFDQELQKLVDSAYVQNNVFILKNNILNEIPRDLSLVFMDSVPKLIRLFVANDNIKISGDKKDFPYDLKITGSKFQTEQNKLNLKTKILQKERAEIVKFWRAEVTVKDEKYYLKQQESKDRASEIDKSIEKIQKNFISANINSYVSLKLLSYLFHKYSRADLQQLYSRLQPKYKNSDYGAALLNYISVGKPLKVNDSVADFEAFDKNGFKHKLSDFKGKYILVDFTKEYCAPCEKAIKELKIINEKYSDKLTIISFNGEKSQDFWKKGLIRNNIPWLSLWDGEGNNGKTLMKYGVRSFPNFFLINKQGKIIELLEGYSDGILEPAVERLFNN